MQKTQGFEYSDHGYILLTGATGLIGRYLMRDLLLDGHRLAVVVRPSKRQSVRERIEEIMQMWERELDKTLPRPVCLAGDVGAPELGLSEAAQYWVANHCDRIIHNAAILSFHGSDRQQEPWRTNVQGTRHVLDLCRATSIRDLHYVSTAYVSGDREGVIQEHELDEGQGFRNDYEQSKFEAEQLVRRDDFLRQVTVYRPAVVGGDSLTGYTNTYHGVYAYLKAMSVIGWNIEPGPDGVRDTPFRIPLTGNEPRNVVPVDWVSAVIARLLVTPEAHGQTFHIAPEKGVTAREIIEAGYSHFNSRGIIFAGPDVQLDLQDPWDQLVHMSMAFYEQYNSNDPVFDRSNLLRFTGDLPCPSVNQSMIARFWKYGEQDRWGKRKPQPARVPCWIDDDLLSHKSEAIAEQPLGAEDDPILVGLDIIGSGGGQWTAQIAQGCIDRIERGIATDCRCILRMPSEQFLQLREKSSEAVYQAVHEQLHFGPYQLPESFVPQLVQLLTAVGSGVA